MREFLRRKVDRNVAKKGTPQRSESKHKKHTKINCGSIIINITTNSEGKQNVIWRNGIDVPVHYLAFKDYLWLERISRDY